MTSTKTELHTYAVTLFSKASLQNIGNSIYCALDLEISVNHIYDCYFCKVPPVSGGFSKKRKRAVQHSNVPYALQPVSHSKGLPIPEPPTDFFIGSDEKDFDTSHYSPQKSMTTSGGNKYDDDFSCYDETSYPHISTLIKLNVHVHDLEMSKSKAAILV